VKHFYRLGWCFFTKAAVTVSALDVYLALFFETAIITIVPFKQTWLNIQNTHKFIPIVH